MHRIMRMMQPMSIIKKDNKTSWSEKIGKYIILPGTLAYSFYYFQANEKPMMMDDQIYQFELPKEEYKNGLLKLISYLGRFIQLSWIFTPSLLLLPLCLFDSTKQYWLEVFLSSIKRAGFVWIKAFQYLSHRADIIGEEMAIKFSVLRQQSPEHKWKDTEQTIKRVYNKQISQIFQQFEQTPIASGSVSQVYKAKMNSQVVAVKVRHPNIGNNLSKDIDLLFIFSKIFSVFSKQFQVPIESSSLKKILAEQLYFLQEKRNMDSFNKIIVDKNVRFPKAYSESTDQVLIQEYIDGKTIGFYENNTHDMNRLIANIGAKAFFSMLMKYNFVHADCHAGNILVKIKQAPNSITNYFYSIWNSIINFAYAKVIKYGLNSDFLRRLSQQNYQYEKEVQNLIQKYKSRVEIVLIDVGMAIRLTKEKKKSFQAFLEQIIKGNAKGCAQWIYRISQYNGKMLIEGENKNYLTDLQTMFKRVHQTSLESLEGIVVLKQMLSVIRAHNMKIDGEISILLTNMLILQAIAKDLDPSINILRCAVPYLHYK